MIENVILDLDHTLIHTPEKVSTNILPYFKFFRYHYVIIDNIVYLIFERPFLREFLQSLRGKNIAIWTAADESYARFIVRNIIEPYLLPGQNISFVWSRRECDDSSAHYGILKHLDMVYAKYGPQFRRENTLIIDDNPDLQGQNNHVFVIKKFLVSNVDDSELLKLMSTR